MRKRRKILKVKELLTFKDAYETLWMQTAKLTVYPS